MRSARPWTAVLAASAAVGVALATRLPTPSPPRASPAFLSPLRPLAARDVGGLAAVAVQDTDALPYTALAFRVGSGGLPELLAPHVHAPWRLRDGLLVAETQDGGGAWLSARWEEVRRMRDAAPEARAWLGPQNALWIGVDAAAPAARLDVLALSSSRWSDLGGDGPATVGLPLPLPPLDAPGLAVALGPLGPREYAAALVVRERIGDPGARVRPSGGFAVPTGCRPRPECLQDELVSALGSAGPGELADAVARATVVREWALGPPPDLAAELFDVWLAGGDPSFLAAVDHALPTITATEVRLLAERLARPRRVEAQRATPRALRPPDRVVTTTLDADRRTVAVRAPGTAFRAHLFRDRGWRDLPGVCQVAAGLAEAPPPLPPGVRVELAGCRWTEVEWVVDGPAAAAHETFDRLQAAFDTAAVPIATATPRYASERRVLGALYGRVEAPPGTVSATAYPEAVRALAGSGLRVAWVGPQPAEEVAGWFAGQPAFRDTRPGRAPSADAVAPREAIVSVTEHVAWDADAAAAWAWSLEVAGARDGMSIRSSPLPDGSLLTVVQPTYASRPLGPGARAALATPPPPARPPPRLGLARAVAPWRWARGPVGPLPWATPDAAAALARTLPGGSLDAGR